MCGRTPGRARPEGTILLGEYLKPFAPSERPKGDVYCATSERLADLLHHQEIRGPREDEATEPALRVAVDRTLHRNQQIPDSLHLIDDKRGGAIDHGLGVRRRLDSQVKVIGR